MYTYVYIYYIGKRDSIHHHLMEAVSETANVLELIETETSMHDLLWLVVVVVHKIALPSTF